MIKMNIVSLLLRGSSRGRTRWNQHAAWLLVGLCPLVFGCQREEIQVYTVAKDEPSPSTAQNSDGSKPRPQVSWTLPAGWKERGSGQMSVANFIIEGPAGQEANVSITPLA